MKFGLAVDESRSPFAVVAVTGEIDVATAPSLQAKLVELVTAGKVDLIVDLQGVDFLDSTGLGVLVSTVKRARSGGGDLSLVCTHPNLLKVFEITGLTKVFAINETLDAAVAERPGSIPG
ncbi:MAG TPA: STAS domain-containing protein [Mycobacteriales bacterium]|jgi:anti-sigma B factor antagonist|nr:STAS domain-containing protein [Mycobacteriales bacterium]